ncbi:MAG: hypothetical protein FWF57_00285 [Defluviitaleaceae bacterium]|nr:hypothetical protein [Defluviitaleaceae bacterium]
MKTLINDSKYILAQSEPNKLKAIDMYISLIKEYPQEEYKVYQTIGNLCYYKLNDLKRAKSYYEKSLEYDNHNPLSYLMLAQIYDDLEELPLAYEFYEKAFFAEGVYKVNFIKFLLRESILNRDYLRKAKDLLLTMQPIRYQINNDSFNLVSFLKFIVCILEDEILRAKQFLKESEITENVAIVEIHKIGFDEKTRDTLINFVQNQKRYGHKKVEIKNEDGLLDILFIYE